MFVPHFPIRCSSGQTVDMLHCYKKLRYKKKKLTNEILKHKGKHDRKQRQRVTRVLLSILSGRGNGPVLTNIVLMAIYAIELGNIHILFSTSVDCLSGRMKLTCLTPVN